APRPRGSWRRRPRGGRAPPSRVMAFASKLVPKRKDPESGLKVRVGTADSVQALTMQEDGSAGVYRLSGVVWHNTGMEIALYGSGGALIYHPPPDRNPGAPAHGRGVEGPPPPRAPPGRRQGAAAF